MFAVVRSATGVDNTIAVKTGETALLQHSWPSDDQPNYVVVSDEDGVIFDSVSGEYFSCAAVNRPACRTQTFREIIHKNL